MPSYVSRCRRSSGCASPRVFDRLAAVQGLSETGNALRPGRYAVLRSTTMQELITLLKEGKDSPLKLTPPSVRKDSELVDFLAQHLWVKADTLRTLLADSALMAQYGTKPGAFYSQVIREPTPYGGLPQGVKSSTASMPTTRSSGRVSAPKRLSALG